MKTGRTLLAVLLVGALTVLLFLGAQEGWLTWPTGPAAPAARENGSGAEAPAGTPPQVASADPAVPTDAGEAWVEYVHDGDTLFLTDGRKVRLLGIDTPEVGEHAECYGDVARERLRAVLPEGTHVRTVADVQPLDRFGRSLLFLFTDDGTLVNLGLIRDGYAEAVVLEPNVLWAAEVEAAEDAAQAASLGMWGAC
ncbi:MAG: thermonuclease family protein [Protaetiibacter sp.]